MLEPENFGSGKVYAIANTKPNELIVDGLYTYLTPKDEYIEQYKKIQLELSDEKPNALKDAADYFTGIFYNQLKLFLINLNKAAKEENKTMMELLPFCDGDSLVSWERFGNSNYRGLVGGALKKIGYEVILK